MISFSLLYEKIDNIAQKQKTANETIAAARESIGEKSPVKATVNISTKSAADILQQNSNSSSNASQRFSNQSQNAGQRNSSLTSSYVTKPTKVPAKLGTNYTSQTRSSV